MKLTLVEGEVIVAVEDYLYRTSQIENNQTVVAIKRNRDNSFEVTIEEDK